jgi:chromosome segregation protein
MQLEVAIDEIEQKIMVNAQEITANTERMENSRQRIDELTQARGRAQQRLAVERHRAAQLRRRIAEEEKAHQSLEDDIQQANASVEQLGQQDRDLSRQLNELQARSEDEKAGIIDLMRRTAQLHNEIQSYTQRREQLENEQQRLGNRKQQVEEELSRLQQQHEEIEQHGRELAGKKENHNQQLEAKQQQAVDLDASRAGINRELAAAKEYRSGLLSRKQLLNDLDQQFEGVDAGIREVLHQKEQNDNGEAFSYVIGMVADLVAVDVSNATLIETALGEHDQYLVVSNSEAFFKDAETLAELPGKVRAVCLDRIPPFMDGRDFTNQEGFVAYAMDLVRYPDEAHRLVQHLLGKTVIVRNFDDALRMFDMNPAGYRYVTQSGELLDPNGMCQLGPASNGAGLISRKSELREIDEQIEEVDGRIASANERLQQTTADIERLEQEQKDLRQAIYEIRAAEADNNAARNNNENAIGRLEQEKPVIDSELQSLDTQIEETRQRKSQAEQTCTELEEENKRREENARQWQQQIDEVNAQRQQLADKLTEAKVAVGQLGQKRAMLADTLRGLRSSQQASDETVRSSAQEAEDAAHRMVQAERTVLAAESRLADLYMNKEKLAASLLDQQCRREQIRREHERIQATVKANRGELTELEDKLHKMQMELQEVRIRVDDLISRIREELDIDLAEAYAEYEHQEDQDWEALEAEINDLKDKIRRLGNVNLDAIAEQEELQQRQAFLTEQLQDVQDSQKQLTELIRRINTESRQKFLESFEKVRENFQELFRKLFGGGKADVYLLDPEDVLESGIEVVARPPGKELRSISLLSGGEKTMTALALLFSIFKSRPSPVCLLDEVDAALDEANTERFNRLVGEFIGTSQFLIITHAKRTMSMANVLYGVTMQEAGVSRRISVRFEQADDVLEDRLQPA